MSPYFFYLCTLSICLTKPLCIVMYVVPGLNFLLLPLSYLPAGLPTCQNSCLNGTYVYLKI